MGLEAETLVLDFGVQGVMEAVRSHGLQVAVGQLKLLHGNLSISYKLLQSRIHQSNTVFYSVLRSAIMAFIFDFEEWWDGFGFN